MILISIVIPTYNRAHVLPRAIDSILAQTYTDWELLIVDDGSDDDTGELVADYIKKEPRIKYFKRPESRLRGGNSCRNIGAEHAIGDYVTYLDSDDYYLETRLESCINFINEFSPICMVSGRCIDDKGNITIGRSRPFLKNETSFDYLLSNETTTATSTYVLKKKVLKEVIWDESLLRNQDWDFFLKVSEKYRWTYFENYDMVVVRSKGERKYMDITSCLKVYIENRDKITNYQDANRYLRIMMEYCSKYYKNIQYAKEYYKLLINNKYKPTKRDIFQIKFPYIFYYLFRVKNFFIRNIRNI